MFHASQNCKLKMKEEQGEKIEVGVGRFIYGWSFQTIFFFFSPTCYLMQRSKPKVRDNSMRNNHCVYNPFNPFLSGRILCDLAQLVRTVRTVRSSLSRALFEPANQPCCDPQADLSSRVAISLLRREPSNGMLFRSCCSGVVHTSRFN